VRYLWNSRYDGADCTIVSFVQSKFRELPCVMQHIDDMEQMGNALARRHLVSTGPNYHGVPELCQVSEI